MEKLDQCRICLEFSRNALDLFDDADLVHKIETISSLNILQSDYLPSKVCVECVENTYNLFDFRTIIITNTAFLCSRQSVKLEDVDSEVHLHELNLEHDKDLQEISDVCFEEVDNQNADGTPEEESEPDNRSEDNIFKCQSCDFICTELRKWKRHKAIHAKVICNECGKELRKTSLKVHMRIHVDSPVFCNICGNSAKNPESLRNHILVHKNVKYQCRECGKTYKYPSGYRNHIKRHLPGYTKKEACEICGKLFHEKKYLGKHLRSHTGEKPYKCEYCKIGFSSSYALKIHIRRHTNEKPYRCEYCGEAFNQKVSLTTHLQSKHLKSEEGS